MSLELAVGSVPTVRRGVAFGGKSVSVSIVVELLRNVPAAYLAQSLMSDAVDVLINGDGGDNAAASSSISAYSYDELVDFWNGFAPYELNTILASPDAAASILKLGEFRDANAGLCFHGTGKMITPFGANLIKTAHIN